MRTFFSGVILLSLCCEAHAVTDSLFVRMNGDSTFIWDSYADENCASTFVTTIRVSNDTVYAIRIDTTHGRVRCECVFHFRFTIVGLSAGTYRAVIFRQYRWFGDTLSQVGTITFNVPSTPTTEMSYSLTQSTCHEALDGVDPEPPPVPPLMTLLQNYPNPFNPSTTIRYGIHRRSAIELIVFNTLGEKVATLRSGAEEPGYHEVQFDGSGLASGVYFYQLRAGDLVQMKKLVIVR